MSCSKEFQGGGVEKWTNQGEKGRENTPREDDTNRLRAMTPWTSWNPRSELPSVLISSMVPVTSILQSLIFTTLVFRLTGLLEHRPGRSRGGESWRREGQARHGGDSRQFGRNVRGESRRPIPYLFPLSTSSQGLLRSLLMSSGLMCWARSSLYLGAREDCGEG
jgi:hypothetical protein